MVDETHSPASFESSYAHRPPWDIGRPQAEIAALVLAGEIRGSVLDVGCGTGEHVLHLAARGFEAWGIDTSPTAIAKAQAKAKGRNEERAVLRTGDALALETLGRTFDTVIDSGVFHVFSDADRARYAKSLATVLAPGGIYFALVFSDREPEWGGPRRIKEGDFAATFTDGWRVVYVRPAKFETVFGQHREAKEAWLARIERV
jgi:SAM-dependent methyltransferase